MARGSASGASRGFWRSAAWPRPSWAVRSRSNAIRRLPATSARRLSTSAPMAGAGRTTRSSTRLPSERIAKTVESFERTIGIRPEGWYCRYAPSIATRRLLVEEGGFLYDSDRYADGLPYWVTGLGGPHLVVPYGLPNNDAKVMGGGIATAGQFFEALRDAFDMLYREGASAPKMMSVGLHLRIAGHPARAAGLERFLDHVQRHSGAWVCRRIDIARHWHAHHRP